MTAIATTPNQKWIVNPINATMLISVIFSFVVLVAAFILGFTALYELFISIGILSSWLAWAFPVLFDFTEVFFAVSLLNSRLQGEDDRFSWMMIVVFTILGIAANSAHVYLAFLETELNLTQAWIAVFATSLFPISIALVTHGLKRIIQRSISRSQLLTTNEHLVQAIADQEEVKEQLQTEIQEQREAWETETQQAQARLSDLRQQVAEVKRQLAEAKRMKKVSDITINISEGTKAKAYQYLDQCVRDGMTDREINGAEVGRQAGISPRQGLNLKKELLPQVRSDTGFMDPTQTTQAQPTNGIH